MIQANDLLRDAVKGLGNILGEKVHGRTIKGYELKAGRSEEEIFVRLFYRNDPNPYVFALRASEVDIWGDDIKKENTK